MITITKEFTKEQLIEQAKKNIEVLRVAVGRVPGAYDAAVIHLKLAEITLASLEEEPVAYIFKHPAGKLFWALTDESNKEQSDVIPVYAASPAPIASEAIENAIEYIRSIVFHIDEDDYHGKHIAHYMQQALAWLEGHSCSEDRLDKDDNQPASGNQAAESNRGNEWTGNPDIDNAIIMLDRIDTLENCDDDRIEAVKAVLRRLAGNSPVTPDGWISCSERMPEDTKMLLAFSQGQIVAAYWNWVMSPIDYKKYRAFTYLSGNILDDVTHWMPLPEPPQEVK
ncbi:DUF551 domain-containing protein [Escherichia coli]|nr:DUF551 domain-containing protein [Escherichia coli]